MTDTPLSTLFTVGKRLVEMKVKVGGEVQRTAVWVDGPDRWEALVALDFDPAFVNQVDDLSRDERLPLIIHWYQSGEVTPEQLNRLLCACWTHGGYPHHQHVSQDDMRDMLAHAGFITDTPGTLRPFEPLTVWRGGVAGAAIGFSWTTDRERAEWFAKRQHTMGHSGAVEV